MSRHAENQSRAQAHENDPDILDAVVRQEPFEIVLHQGIQDAENGGDDSDDEHQQSGPGWHASQRIQENAGHAIDSGLDHDAGKQRRDIARCDRVGRRQPDMEGNDTRLNAESQEEQNKRGGLLAAGQMGCGGAEAGEFGAAAGVDQQSKTQQQAPGSRCAP